MDDHSPQSGMNQSGISLQARLVARLSLADYQNAVPVLGALSVLHHGTETLHDLELVLDASPGFVQPRRWFIATLHAGQCHECSDLQVSLDGAQLNWLNEATRVTLRFTLRRAGVPEDLAFLEQTLEVLPRNQWGGLADQPERVAAFVQPNAPVVEHLLKLAADLLHAHGRLAAFDGYQHGAAHAWELAAAVWGAIATLGVDYAPPPASFELTGQKVRSPGRIVETGLATCLDLALLFCAACEQAGLNPLLVFMRGHAFAGIWLSPENADGGVIDDSGTLRREIRLNRLLLCETTLLTQRPASGFAQAIQAGAQQLAQAHEDAFELAVDIHHARLQGIKPLASGEAPVFVVAAGKQPAPALDLPPVWRAPPPSPPAAPIDDRLADHLADRLADHLADWPRRLLEGSPRHNLLNFRAGKHAFKLTMPHAASLQESLLQGLPLHLCAKPETPAADLGRGRATPLYQRRAGDVGEPGQAALPRHDLWVEANGEDNAQDNAQDLPRRLLNLHRAVRNHLQEGSGSTLFIALGFLSWTRDASGPRYRAPLILVPVSLQREQGAETFCLMPQDDAPCFNPALADMLRHDFSLDLGLDTFFQNETGWDLAATWQQIRLATQNLPEWEVSEDIMLATFSLARFLMWQDVHARFPALREHTLLRHLLGTPDQHYPTSIPFPNPRWLDREIRPEQTYCPLPADASQQVAIMAGARGKDFVLIGPPGTGKSQTIANLIAQCLAQDKRVLFVSAKITALDVVARRLREAGLGEFCLPLLTGKVQTRDVLAQWQTAWQARGEVDADAWHHEAERLKNLRDELNTYVERLHFRHGNGLSLYEAMARVIGGQSIPRVSLHWASDNLHDPVTLDAMREVAERLEAGAYALGQGLLRDHPLRKVEHAEWSPEWQQGFIRAVLGALQLVQCVEQSAEAFLLSMGLPLVALDRRSRGALAVLAHILPLAGRRNWGFVLRVDAKTLLERLQAGTTLLSRHRQLSHSLSRLWPESVIRASQRGLALLRQRRRLHAQITPWPLEVVVAMRKGLWLLEEVARLRPQLSVQYGDEIEQIDVEGLWGAWLKAEKSPWPLSWLGKQQVQQRLQDMVQGDGQARVADDLPLLLKLRELRFEIASLAIDPAGDGIWAGQATRVELARCALAFQQILEAARYNRAWKDEGLDAVAAGLCGEQLARELQCLRSLREQDEEIRALAYLGKATQGLWNGADTDPEPLEAALAFITAVQGIRESGRLPGYHPAIERGVCGPVLSADFLCLRQRAELEQRLSDFEDLCVVTQGVWNGLQTNAEEIEQVMRFHATLTTAMGNLALACGQTGGIRIPMQRLLGDNKALLQLGGTVFVTGGLYLKAWNCLQPALDNLAAAGRFSTDSKTQMEAWPLQTLSAQCAIWEGEQPRLRAWCDWQRTCGQAQALGLSPLVRAIEQGVITLGQTQAAFETNYCRWWVHAALEHDSFMRDFVSSEHERHIHDFRRVELRFGELTRAWIRATLCAELPLPESETLPEEWHVLRQEIAALRHQPAHARTAHRPLRELIARMPGVVSRLSPCLLMNPLSVAQYLPAAHPPFDLVVFDEASQIPVWDAIGSMARARQVIVVGDPEQLPPSPFFEQGEALATPTHASGVPPHGHDAVSILDECLRAHLPTLKLSWHYRSRHESLIAFANQRYYAGQLQTFPAPLTAGRAVKLHIVEGLYERGHARINRPEAEALVAALVARLKSPAFADAGWSVGVVTSNSEQQALIEDLLDVARARDPVLEACFSEARTEPVMVKNLENVQGDERDVMYFSLTYGPDAQGVLSMNFGPMNRRGGERRLNVAMTRARHELHVFASFTPARLDLSRVRAPGLRDLRHFLDYAQSGHEGMHAHRSEVAPSGAFEETVAAALRGKGWQVRTQVGVSAFRIDLGVVHPDTPDVYLCGIECDGQAYLCPSTARDRDSLREQVLRAHGWHMQRVWSSDWWEDPRGALEKLDFRLNALLDLGRTRPG